METRNAETMAGKIPAATPGRISREKRPAADSPASTVFGPEKPSQAERTDCVPAAIPARIRPGIGVAPMQSKSCQLIQR